MHESHDPIYGHLWVDWRAPQRRAEEKGRWQPTPAELRWYELCREWASSRDPGKCFRAWHGGWDGWSGEP